MSSIRVDNTLSACVRLMRLDKPIGSLLLMAPTLWALWLTTQGRPDPVLVVIMIAGVFTSRSAGCVINDITDRDIDGHVERTQARPLAAGDVGLGTAVGLAVLLGFIALGLLLMLPRSTWGWALLAVLVTIAYPRFKRFFDAPQLVLSVAFSMGIPMVWAATGYVMGETILLIWLANVLWVLVYDTEYAMSDRPDDLKLGVRSTAILLGDHDRWVIGLWQVACLSLLVYVGFKLNTSFVYYVLLAFAGLTFCYQQWLIRDRERQACFLAFKNNTWFGFGVWLAIMLGSPIIS